METWQPVRLRVAHKLPLVKRISPEELKDFTSKIHLVRPVQADAYIVEAYKVGGCDAVRFYEIKGTTHVCCEHEILTD